MEGHLEMLRTRYHSKRDTMLQASRRTGRHTGASTIRREDFTSGAACRATSRANLAQRGAQERVAFVIGEPFHVDGGGHQYIRLSFASPDEERIEEGIRRMGNGMQRMQARRSPHDEQGTFTKRIPMI